MAIDGDLFRSVPAALSLIDDAAASAARQARAVGMTGPQTIVGARFPTTVGLARIDDAAFELVVGRAFDDIAWIDDGWCSGRSLLVSQMFADAVQRPLAAGINGVAPQADAIAGAVAIADGPFRISGRKLPWNYHAAAIVWPESSHVPLVLDGALFRRPVPLEAWAQRLGVPVKDIKLRHPWDLRGLSISGSLAEGASRIRTELSNSVQAIADTGAPVDNPLLRGAPITYVGAPIEDVGRGAAYARRFAERDFDSHW